MPRTFILKSGALVTVSRLPNPFHRVKQSGVLTIDPVRYPGIATSWASDALDRSHKAVLPFPGHVRYYA